MNLNQEVIEMDYPKIGETITTKWAVELCKHFGLDYLVERIRENPDSYKNWIFDGVSVLCDKFAAGVTGVDQEILTNQCALPHDLAYAYGESGNDEERKAADSKFKADLINKAKMSTFWASIFHHAVRIGGMEELGLSFTWAFAKND